MSINLTKQLREVIKAINAEGFTVLNIERTKHYKITIRKDDIEFRVVVPSTASDFRYLRNVQGHIRKMFQERQSLTV